MLLTWGEGDDIWVLRGDHVVELFGEGVDGTQAIHVIFRSARPMNRR